MVIIGVIHNIERRFITNKGNRIAFINVNL